jgi:hypothetical protein
MLARVLEVVVELPTLMVTHDKSDPDHPVRLMTFASGQMSPSVIVRKVGARPGFLERIDLLEQDADIRLARYLLPNISMLSSADT